ncbi:HEPN domain-containing protein [Candidatus Parcubacteria bacterium]|nr:HEPN domain-containing protein [Candidatus Parcubacteria bacterium]MCG2700947.1 HEPN domain-containing protein [Candidatus Parcubacteria bacterium]
MGFTKKQLQEIISYWREMADHDWKTAQSLWQSKRYDACLFYCHLALEKLLKGLVTQETEKTAPYIHDLEELSKRANIDVDYESLQQLAAFTNFNMRCRYPRHKQAFYKLCTCKFSEPYFNKTKPLMLWLKKFYQTNK